METTAEKWYKQTGWIIALIFLFFPIGLYLLWTSKKLSASLKVLITVAYIGLATAALCVDNYKGAKKIQRIFKEAFR